MKRRRIIMIIIAIITGTLTVLYDYLGKIAGQSPLPSFIKPYLSSVWPILFVINAVVAGLTELQKAFEQKDVDHPAPAQESQNRQRMLERVRALWITGVLEHSLHEAAFIILGLHEQRDAIANPWRLVLQQPEQPESPLPPGTSITKAYKDAGGELLILGEPGAGKTTLLLELTRNLLDQAEQDDTLQIPVVLNLSSWATKQQPLAQWLVEELMTKYQVPHKLGQAWVNNDQILPLLDGLDEVTSNARAACVEAINTYRQAHMVPTVVCSRRKEYLTQTKRVALRNAVVVQPLTIQQIDAYLESAGEQARALCTALRQDADLRELATTPLMLTILVFAYRETSPGKISELTSLEAKREQIFASYVQHMLKRRGASKRYKPEQSIRWLSQLARQMSQQNQTVFYVELMQSDWLPEDRSRWLYRGIAVGLVPGLLPGLLYGFYTWGNSGSLVGGLLVGLVAWLLFGLISMVGKERKAAEVVVWSWTRVWRNLGKGLLVGLGSGLLAWLLVGLHYGPMRGLAIGLAEWLSGGIFSGLLFELIEWTETEIKPVEVIVWSWRGARRGLGKGLLVGLVVVLVFGLYFGLFYELFQYESLVRLAAVLIFGLIVGMAQGLPFGLLVVLNFGLFSGLSSGILDEQKRMTPNQGIWNSARNSMRVGLISGLITGTLFGLANWFIVIVSLLITGTLFRLADWFLVRALWFQSLAFGLSYGLTVGMAFGLRGGGLACIKHVVLRLLLWHTRSIPWNYPRFLDHATERILLRRVGGGYMFIHRLLLDYFAAFEKRES